jgi:two-component system, NarL family, nitrate/nitrite response regulator NarL
MFTPTPVMLTRVTPVVAPEDVVMTAGNESSEQIHVAVFEPRRLIRESISVWLSAACDDVDVAIATDSVRIVAEHCETDAIDVILTGIDVQRPRMVKEAAALAARYPTVRVVAMTSHVPPASDAATHNAFDVIVPNGTGALNLLRVLREEAAHHGIDSPVVEVDPSHPLTQRETEVLALVGQGSTTHDISSQLGISRSTVASHKERIFSKLQANNQAHAVARAVSLGLITTTFDEEEASVQMRSGIPRRAS